MLLFDGTNYKVLWLFAAKPVAHWVQSGDPMLADAGQVIIGPTEGVMVQPRFAALKLPLFGEVRTWHLAQPLHSGTQLIGTGYPIAMSPTDRGMTQSSGFFADSDVTTADSIRLWTGDQANGHIALRVLL